MNIKIICLLCAIFITETFALNIGSFESGNRKPLNDDETNFSPRQDPKLCQQGGYMDEEDMPLCSDTEEEAAVGWPIESDESDPEIQDCINNCPASSEERPVCGSNGKTYANLDRMICASICKIDVTMASEGPCPEAPPTEKPDEDKGTPQTPDEDDPKVQDCIRECPASSVSNPVCGSNGKTYNNADRLICASICGVGVSMESQGPCPNTTPSPTEEPDKGKTTLDEDDPKVKECIGSCPASSVSNPVCGSNGKTYNNAERLICASICGVGVSMESQGPCPNTTPSPTEETDKGKTTIDEDDPRVKECIDNCPASSVSNPVCGSNGRTYNNADRLICASICGVGVSMESQGPCPDSTPSPTEEPDKGKTTLDEDDPRVKECIDNCPASSVSNPVCGSNGRTYNNADRIVCASICGVDVSLATNGPCPKLLTRSEEKNTTLNENNPRVRKCVLGCPSSSDESAVCGSNGKTYANSGQVHCLNRCGVDLTVVKKAPCRVDEYGDDETTASLQKRGLNCRPRPTIPDADYPIIFPDTILDSVYAYNPYLPICPDDLTLNREGSTKRPGRNEQDPAVQRCISKCAVTPEYNPVCGSNGQTYSNPGRLDCASSCGVDVNMVRQGQCPNEVTSPPQR